VTALEIVTENAIEVSMDGQNRRIEGNDLTGQVDTRVSEMTADEDRSLRRWSSALMPEVEAVRGDQRGRANANF
jgi:hypothetical protein